MHVSLAPAPAPHELVGRGQRSSTAPARCLRIGLLRFGESFAVHFLGWGGRVLGGGGVGGVGGGDALYFTMAFKDERKIRKAPELADTTEFQILLFARLKHQAFFTLSA